MFLWQKFLFLKKKRFKEKENIILKKTTGYICYGYADQIQTEWPSLFCVGKIIIYPICICLLKLLENIKIYCVKLQTTLQAIKK